MSNEFDGAYLDYYNFITDKNAVSDENAVKQFVDRYGIKKPIISEREIIPVEDLFLTQGCFFRETFEALTKYQSRIIDMADQKPQQLDSYYADPDEQPPFLVVSDIKEHLKRTTPALVEVQPKTGYLWRGFWCQDFLALVYLQLWMSVNGKYRYAVCPHCKKTFATTKSTKKHCSKKCKKNAAEARYRAKRKANPKKREAYNERMKRYMKTYLPKKS